MSLKKSGKGALKLAEELINIRSDKKNPAMIKFLKKALLQNGWKNIRESGGNVWGSIGRGKTTILYDIHSDTIAARRDGWEGEPFKARISKGRLYGRGSVDDKGPLAAAIFSGNFIKDSKDYKVYLLASDKEETDEGYGCRIFLKTEKLKPDFVLISEPSALQLVFGQRGRIEITLTARGIPAHGSMPEKGKNAILMLNEAISALGKIKFKALAPFTATSIAPTVIKSEGEGKNVLPLSCSLLLDIRINHRESVDSISEILRKKLPRGIEIKAGKFCPAWLLQNKAYAGAAKKAFSAAYGKKASPAYWKFCTNGSSYSARGIPVIGFGPGEPQLCHKKNESIKISDVEKSVDFFRLLPSHIAEAVK